MQAMVIKVCVCGSVICKISEQKEQCLIPQELPASWLYVQLDFRI